MNTNVYDLTQSFPNVLLIGNGVLKSCVQTNFDRTKDWNEYIGELSSGHLQDEQKRSFEDIPYSVQASIVVPQKDSERYAKYEECFVTAQYIVDTALRDLASIPFDAILTTNYTYEIENVFFAGYDLLK